MPPAPIDANFGFIAGSVALDFVNTVHWRLDGANRYDALEDYQHLLRWAELAGLLDPKTESDQLAHAARTDSEAAAESVRTARVLREAIYAAVQKVPNGAGALTAAFIRAQGRARLRLDADGWHWVDAHVDLQTPVDRIARSAIVLLTSDPKPTIGQCADEACGWLFIDNSRRHNRRWCTAAGCGDRNRARQYYRRQRAWASEVD